MSTVKETLQRLSDERLIDVARNYQVYGYDEDVRNTALALLAERGFTTEDLSIAGSNKASSHDAARIALRTFKRSSLTSMALWILTLLTFMLGMVGSHPHTALSTFFLILSLVSALSYAAALFLSVVRIVQFYRLLGRSDPGLIALYVVGMPLITIYPFVRNRMREDLAAAFATKS